MFERIKSHLDTRFSEWAISLGLLTWGIIVFSQQTLFEGNSNFEVMSQIADEKMWGFSAILIGAIRLIFLFVNGTYQQSGHIRAVGAILSIIIWTFILASYAALPFIAPNLASLFLIITIDMYNLWHAAGDARKADIKAETDKEELRRLKDMMNDYRNETSSKSKM